LPFKLKQDRRHHIPKQKHNLAQAARGPGCRHRPDPRGGADHKGDGRRRQTGALLDQVVGPVASLTADGAYDQEGVSTTVAERHPEAAIIVPPRSTAVPSETAEIAPTQPDRHLRCRTRTRRLAESLRLHEAGSSRGSNRQVQAGDRRRAALAHGPASGNRGERHRPCPQPNAGDWTPDLCPRRLNPRAGLGLLRLHS
jgi:hypothetical protein